MKICIVVTGLPPESIGGTETQTNSLAKHLAKSHEVTIITRRKEGMPAESKRDGFVIRRFRYFNFPLIRFFSHIVSGLIEARRQKKSDVFYCMMLSPNGLVGVLAKKLFGVRTIASIRGGDWYTPGKMGSLINRFVIKNSDFIAAQTDVIKRDVLNKHPDAKVEVIPNGVDIGRERAKGKNIIFMGNLKKRKGTDVLIRAMEHTDAELTIVGDGAERKVLEEMAAERNLEGKVSFVGKVSPDKARLHLMKGRLFVLPSIVGEGMPNVILEAMSVGLPVVSTRTSGIPDMVKHGETGLLVEPGDPAQLADAMNKILKDNELHRKMVKNTVREIEKYSWKNVTETAEKVFSKR